MRTGWYRLIIGTLTGLLLLGFAQVASWLYLEHVTKMKDIALTIQQSHIGDLSDTSLLLLHEQYRKTSRVLAVLHRTIESRRADFNTLHARQQACRQAEESTQNLREHTLTPEQQEVRTLCLRVRQQQAAYQEQWGAELQFISRTLEALSAPD